ncbi:MAG: DNA replication/repair protein RecF [Xanthomonadales bacterium]|nr:DNA replication/repair protein RecF [Xanthomonadales bacterium]
MKVLNLTINNFRNIEQAFLAPHPRLNFIIGANGAGKTSVLESLVMLSKGRSFRGGSHRDLIGPTEKHLQLYCELENRENTHKLGIERGTSRWRGRLDGEELKQRSGLAHLLPYVLFEPNSHLLVDGGPVYRRQYLDWSVFHVKQNFLSAWYRFHRSLKQRNALLKQTVTNANQTILDSLDIQLAEAALAITGMRKEAFNTLIPHITQALASITTTIPGVSFEYNRGWSGEGYTEYLAENRKRDSEAGQTLGGPHRADITLLCGRDKVKDRFSRGQQKALACAMLVAQIEHLQENKIEPLLLLDDPASELDGDTLSCLFKRVCAGSSQLWITSVAPELPTWLGDIANHKSDYAVFHVKHGKVSKML